MNFVTFVKITLIIDVILIEYGQAQLDEGNPCILHDGSQGACKNTNTKLKRGVRKAESACAMYSKTHVRISWIIFGGLRSAPGEFPYMAALGYRLDQDALGDINSDFSFDCGGTLISDNFVLTSAHCVTKPHQPEFVRLGKVALLTDEDDAEPVDMYIEEIIRHPKYNGSLKKNDIALIQLARHVNFTQNIRPACLRTDFDDLPSDVELTITGWGNISSERIERPSVLLKANLRSMPLQECNARLMKYNTQADLSFGLSVDQYCAFDPEGRRDACYGDGSGPLVAFPDSVHIARVVGINSFGIGCVAQSPSVYTRVASYLDWIEPIVWPNL